VESFAGKAVAAGVSGHRRPRQYVWNTQKGSERY
jgi:hypothetical protein